MFKGKAHKYLIKKGCVSIAQKYTAYEIENMLNEFATQQSGEDKKLNLPNAGRSFTLKDLKAAFEQGSIYQYDNTIKSKSMNVKDFDSWYDEVFVKGSVDIFGIKTEPK